MLGYRSLAISVPAPAESLVPFSSGRPGTGKLDIRSYHAQREWRVPLREKPDSSVWLNDARDVWVREQFTLSPGVLWL